MTIPARGVLLAVAGALSLMISTILPAEAQGKRAYQEMPLSNGSVLRYALVLPDGFVAADSHPILIAIPPGDQSERMVEAGLSQYWEAEGRSRGWVVASPVAPPGGRFWNGTETLVVELATKLSSDFNAENERIHLAGISNGGRSAFSVALASPDRFSSLTVLPGVVATNADLARLGSLRDLDVNMYVGEKDASWIEGMTQVAEALTAAGVETTLRILPGEPHVIGGGIVPDIFDRLDALRVESAVNESQP